jgi:hypothetical protein
MNDEQTLPTKTLSHLAWWSADLARFSATSDERIIERLNLRLVEAHFTARADQIAAWRGLLPILRNALATLPSTWRLLLEYPLLRLGRRLDAVLVTDRAIIVFEFKTAAIDKAALLQAEDYARDLRDFHAASRHHPVVPIVVSLAGTPPPPTWPLLWLNYDNPAFAASPLSLPDLLIGTLARIDHRGVPVEAWEHSPYRPVPTIIEAALMLYRKHGVEDIKAARADANNLTVTTDAILQAVRDAKAGSCHIAVFVTGIPGAGKTLCGLNVVFSADTESAFLTGTLPMVYVLRAALAKDAWQSGVKSKDQATRETKSKIQSITGFLKDQRDRTEPPAEHVIVFDEAQRAWDADYGAQKFGLADSEAGIVLDIMHRHSDYGVIVALVGNGQEINTGEAGLQEWGKALQARPEWQIRAAPGVIDAAEPRQTLFIIKPAGLTIEPALHLDVPVRQIRSSAAAPWVDAVLRGATDEAADIATETVPFLVTRSLADMRRALRQKSGGNRRAGLVCSSGAKRLVADGIWPKFDHLDDDAVANWFLKSWPADVRASDALEIPATEFACQGLELDYVGLCWGGDFVWTGRWTTRNFSGTKWQYPKKPAALEFSRNTYRVLLTRARFETIIWVPAGDSTDPTREPALFDQTASYLLTCGAKPLAIGEAVIREERKQLFF